ncbi:hypothetical protein [Cellulophaga sp. Ld12]|uniref:hypothetical protein n=1 Tax=Cellulophaga sp. Ld12 TaxID=3229535 RepID=UPI0038701F66
MKKPKNIYYLNLELFMSYEIYVNDLKITNNIQSGPVSGLEYLNDYILNSGVQKIKLIDRDLKTNSNIPDDLFSQMKLEIFTSDENEENIEQLNGFDFPSTSIPRPYYFEYTWEFDAEVPYEIEGWKNGKDLTQLDSKELEKMLLDKFKYFKKILNDGEITKFMNENSKNYSEFITANYYQNKWDEYEENISETIGNQKGCLLPLENYKMIISGDGKLVTLERTDIKYLGESALLAVNNTKNKLYTNYMHFYMPEDSEELEPIRLRIEYATADISKVK